MASTKKLTPAQQWDLDVASLRNRALAQNARLHDRLRAAYPSLGQDSEIAEAPKEEEKLLIRPENVGVGAKWEPEEDSLTGNDSASKTAKSGIFGSSGDLEKLRRTVLGKRRKVNGTLMRKDQRGRLEHQVDKRHHNPAPKRGAANDDDSDEEEEGRAGAFKSKSAKTVSRGMHSTDADKGKNPEDVGRKINATTAEAHKYDKAHDDEEEWDGFSSTPAGSRATTPSKKPGDESQSRTQSSPVRPASYLDEVLAGRNKKRKKKKKKRSAPQTPA